MVQAALPQAPDRMVEDQQALVDLLLDLRKSHVQDFLRRAGLPRTGTKEELRERLRDAIAARHITCEQVVEFLDSKVPWGKQHVFLFKGPRGDVQAWKDSNHVSRLLEEQQIAHLLNASLPLILPEKLTLSSITHAKGTLRITAIQKKQYNERAAERDEEKEDEDGDKITLKAYLTHRARALVAFEWDLNANVAMLQITQLKKDKLYEEVAKEFFSLVAGWLDIDQFELLDIRPAINRLREVEKTEKAEARTQRIGYRTLRGSQVSVRSASPRDSAVAEDVVNAAMTNVAKEGVGHLGKFYWLAGSPQNPNPLKRDVRMIIVGDKSRINFPTPNSEEVVRYVLQRVRAHSTSAS